MDAAAGIRPQMAAGLAGGLSIAKSAEAENAGTTQHSPEHRAQSARSSRSPPGSPSLPGSPPSLPGPLSLSSIPLRLESAAWITSRRTWPGTRTGCAGTPSTAAAGASPSPRIRSRSRRSRCRCPRGPVLELASGPSGSALAAAAAGRNVTAVDVSDVALDMLAAEAQRRGVLGDLITSSTPTCDDLAPRAGRRTRWCCAPATGTGPVFGRAAVTRWPTAARWPGRR